MGSDYTFFVVVWLTMVPFIYRARIRLCNTGWRPGRLLDVNTHTHMKSQKMPEMPSQ